MIDETLLTQGMLFRKSIEESSMDENVIDEKANAGFFYCLWWGYGNGHSSFEGENYESYYMYKTDIYRPPLEDKLIMSRQIMVEFLSSDMTEDLNVEEKAQFLYEVTVAVKKHFGFVQKEESSKPDDKTNKWMIPWVDLPEFFRDKCRVIASQLYFFFKKPKKGIVHLMNIHN